MTARYGGAVRQFFLISFFMKALSELGSGRKYGNSRLKEKIDAKPIEMALYEESYCRLRVLIVADCSDAEFERCTLQVVEHIGLTAAPCAPQVGARFTYLRHRDIHCHGMARLVRNG